MNLNEVNKPIIKGEVVVYAGRFQPFHKGHYAAYSKLVSKFGKDKIRDVKDFPKKGIDFKIASEIIGNHFADVKDKLLNFLELSSQQSESVLLLASIEQKGNDLQPIPFSNAIDFSKNKRFLPYAILPIVFLILFFQSCSFLIV